MLTKEERLMMTMTERKPAERMAKASDSKRPSTSGKEKCAKLLVMGDTGVGKTALIVRCLTRRFLPEYISGLDSSDLYKTTTGNETLNLELVDCNSQNEDVIRSGDGFVLVYSVLSRTSMKRLQDRVDLIRGIHGEQAPIAIVANKRDLMHLRNVSTVEGIQFSSGNGASFFCELSVSKDYEMIPRLFLELYKVIDTKRAEAIEKQQRSSGKNKGEIVSKMLTNIKDIVRRSNSR